MKMAEDLVSGRRDQLAMLTIKYDPEPALHHDVGFFAGASCALLKALSNDKGREFVGLAIRKFTFAHRCHDPTSNGDPSLARSVIPGRTTDSTV